MNGALKIALLLSVFAVIPSAAFAAAPSDPAMTTKTANGKIWVDPKGMTLYTFDKDKKGEKASACVGACIKEWPPLLAPKGAKASGEWTLLPVVDKNGKTQQMWAYNGKPFYLFLDDKKPGDMTGDNKDGFHIAKDAS
jgi:predicted lipoprotein with Yx(FWY)xxD motif